MRHTYSAIASDLLLFATHLFGSQLSSSCSVPGRQEGLVLVHDLHAQSYACGGLLDGYGSTLSTISSDNEITILIAR